METLIGIFVFMFGAIIGSFLNVCIHRIPKNESIVFPMSHCPNCNRNIFWYDNIPMLSYIVLKGECRFCGSKISPRYFVIEFLTALFLFLLFLAFGITPKFFAYSVFTCGLIVATFVDFEIQEIPDQISIGGIVVGLASAAIFPSIFDTASRFASIPNSFLGAAIGGASTYAMGVLGHVVFKKEAMGGGDVKLMAMVGAFLGWKLAIVTFFVAPLFGSVAGIILKLKDGREVIPYGPYLSLAALIAIFFGNRIIGMFFGGLF
ncbi:MAG: prepilin peptidase [Candidatus Omnitrophica bacterium]|nr:prepilin peptidase [Candidatus Omnitrophota bacterium]